MSKIRILHVCWDGNTGGLPKVLHELTNVQRTDNGLEVSVCFAKGEGPFYSKIKSLGIPIYVLALKNGFYLKGAKLVYQLITEKKFDIVQLHNVSFFIFWGSWFAKHSLKRLKLIYNDHGVLLRNEGIFSYVNLKRVVLTRPLMKWFCNRIFDHSIVNSHFVEQKFYNLGVRPEKISLIYYGLEPNNVKVNIDKQNVRQNLGFGQNDFLVGTVTRFVWLKRVDRLVKTASFLTDMENLYFIVAGFGPLEEYFKQLASAHHLDGMIKFMGKTTTPYDLMNAFDLFVFPSRGEAFAVTVVEACVLGVPQVIFSDAGGMTELIRNKINGFVVKDEKELADIIRSVRNDRALLERISLEAKRSVQNMTTATFARKLKEVYRNLDIETCYPTY